MFITFEGIDGAGKTTQADLLRTHLERQGRTVVGAREPGGTPLGERIRELLLDGTAMSPASEASLFAAARAELVERVIGPALERGHDVVLDRYVDSSLAYQCGGRGLELEPVLAWNRFCVGGPEPDLTFLLALPAEVERGESLPDRIESESLAFRRSVEAAYRKLAGRFSGRIVTIDAALPRDEIATIVRARISALEDAATALSA
jgi:dTMP kinase